MSEDWVRKMAESVELDDSIIFALQSQIQPETRMQKTDRDFQDVMRRLKAMSGTKEKS